jgi:FdhE protein
MFGPPWQRRIQRAEELARKFPFAAAEILGFYLSVARFQNDLQRQLGKTSALQSQSVLQELGGECLSQLLPPFGSFLSMVEAHGPERLSKLSRELQGCGEEFWANLLNGSWTAYSPSDSQGFLGRAFLQPYAELLRTRASLPMKSCSPALCPFCNRKPGLGVLRQQGDGASRWLICSFCLAEWEFRRIVCAGCGEEDSNKLPVYTAGEFDHIRLECCDTCKTYIKSVDLTKNGLAEPVVDEIASVPLDLWAQSQNYAKLEPNLLGL